jgi:hypothetical protein
VDRKAMSDSSATRYMLTTFDNPFNPFTQFDEWFQWDVAAGYHTSALLGRITIDSPELSDTDQEEAIQIAIDEIVRENVSGMFRKVTEKDFQKTT